MAEPTPTDAIVQLSFAVIGVLTELAAENDLSLTQLRLLGILRDREPTMLDLARHLKLEKSSVTGLIDRAVKRGLVERVAATHDGRAIHVRLTEPGHALAALGTARVEASMVALLAPLAPRDRARLAALAEAVVSGSGDGFRDQH
ncbi:MarR family winged helix-turn-helix transcriptional regulator [Solirubrobacter soli]|uniref:MarR family winged helix-turn-helix transcriptional regulator n=1 Tax=Solirubrobacter soli TaxID=363832 RepID=UPI000421D5AB|nr:MarR family transcriptional regulator [Solirubrobacter soli]